MVKRIISYLGIATFLLAFYSCNQFSSDKSKIEDDLDVYVVGANLTLTGNAAHWGVNLREGLEFGFVEAQKDLPDASVVVRFEDNKMNSREAVSIAKRFIDVDKVDLMIGGYTPIVKSIIEISEKAQIPLLATLTSAVDVTRNKSWVFRDFITEEINMPLLAEYAYKTEGYRTGTFLVVNDDFGRDARRFFELNFTSFGGLFLGGEYFETTDLDLRNKVGKIMTTEPEFILLVGRGSAMINACRQIREVDKDVRIYSAAGINDPKMWQGLGTDGEGIVFARIDYDDAGMEFGEINAAFKSAYGYDMNWVNVYGYSIARYLTKGFSVAGKDKDKMRKYLKTLDFNSIRGRLVMNENSEIITSIKLFLRQDGASVPID